MLDLDIACLDVKKTIKMLNLKQVLTNDSFIKLSHKFFILIFFSTVFLSYVLLKELFSSVSNFEENYKIALKIN